MTTLVEFKNDYMDEIRSIDNGRGLGNYTNSYYYAADGDLSKERSRLVHKYSWAIPSIGAVRGVADLVKANNLTGVIEIGAGNGYWAYCLRQVGVDVIAVDSGGSHLNYSNPHWHPIVKGGPPHAALHPNRALLLCWPPMEIHKKAASKIWRKKPEYHTKLEWSDPARDIEYQKWCSIHGDWSYWNRRVKHACGPTNMGGASVERFKGEWVIYVGESEGGCTGDETMWMLLNRDYTLVNEFSIHQYNGLHDSCYVYRRGKHEEYQGRW